MVPNPIGELLQLKDAAPGVLLLLELAKLAIVAAIVFLVWRYFTRNKWLLALVAAASLYFFFVAA